MEGKTTTIQIIKEDAESLEKLKLHPSQPIREIVHMLLEDKEFENLTTSIMKERWELIVDLSEIKGPKREELLKRGYI